MYVWYTKAFHGGYNVAAGEKAPEPKPLSNVVPHFIQEVHEDHVGLPLRELEKLYPPEKKLAHGQKEYQLQGIRPFVRT